MGVFLRARYPSKWTILRAGPLGPLGSSSSQHRRTLELILQEGSAFFQASNPRNPGPGPPRPHYRGTSLIRKLRAGICARSVLPSPGRGPHYRGTSLIRNSPPPRAGICARTVLPSPGRGPPRLRAATSSSPRAGWRRRGPRLSFPAFGAVWAILSRHGQACVRESPKAPPEAPPKPPPEGRLTVRIAARGRMRDRSRAPRRATIYFWAQRQLSATASNATIPASRSRFRCARGTRGRRAPRGLWLPCGCQSWSNQSWFDQWQPTVLNAPGVESRRVGRRWARLCGKESSGV